MQRTLLRFAMSHSPCCLSRYAANIAAHITIPNETGHRTWASRNAQGESFSEGVEIRLMSAIVQPTITYRVSQIMLPSWMVFMERGRQRLMQRIVCNTITIVCPLRNTKWVTKLGRECPG